MFVVVSEGARFARCVVVVDTTVVVFDNHSFIKSNLERRETFKIIIDITVDGSTDT